MLENMLIGWLVSICLVLGVISIHKNFISLIENSGAGLKNNIYFVVFVFFVAHMIESGLFAIGYFISSHYLSIGTLLTEQIVSIREYLYFSIVTFTSLGLGDIYPTGELRLIAGIEALIGLLLIGWSASYIFSIYLKK